MNIKEIDIMEVNRVIATFMGREGYIPANLSDMSKEQRLKYMEYLSLDALVPVWEKLKMDYVHLTKGTGVVWNVNLNKRVKRLEYIDLDESLLTIQESAAYATAKLILELRQVG